MAPQMAHTMYWMWPKRKFDSRSLVQPMTAPSSSNDSWEEQAFAEDSAAGALGGCIWPPRSYTCSFCRREFRSAQALGGHMNVHRRDRARLKQSPNSYQVPSTSYQSQSHLSTLTCNPNPSDPVLPLSPLKVRSLSRPQENRTEDLYGSHQLLPGRDLGVLGLKLGRENSNVDEMGWRAPKAHFSLDLAVKPSELLESRSPEIDDEEDEGEEDEASSRKRQKNDEPPPHIFIKSNLGEQRTTALLPFFIKTSLGERHHLNSDVIEIRSSPMMDDLDLELRLGDRPKVK